MVGYKLFRKRKDGSYGSLFINRKKRYSAGILYNSESHETVGYKYRPYFHICSKPIAPHLSLRGRVWCEVEFDKCHEMKRPENQGGMWFLAESIKILREMEICQPSFKK